MLAELPSCFDNPRTRQLRPCGVASPLRGELERHVVERHTKLDDLIGCPHEGEHRLEGVGKTRLDKSLRTLGHREGLAERHQQLGSVQQSLIGYQEPFVTSRFDQATVNESA
jgi:hypothetical protein